MLTLGGPSGRSEQLGGGDRWPCGVGDGSSGSSRWLASCSPAEGSLTRRSAGPRYRQAPPRSGLRSQRCTPTSARRQRPAAQTRLLSPNRPQIDGHAAPRRWIGRVPPPLPPIRARASVVERDRASPPASRPASSGVQRTIWQRRARDRRTQRVTERRTAPTGRPGTEPGPARENRDQPRTATIAAWTRPP